MYVKRYTPATYLFDLSHAVSDFLDLYRLVSFSLPCFSRRSRAPPTRPLIRKRAAAGTAALPDPAAGGRAIIFIFSTDFPLRVLPPPRGKLQAIRRDRLRRYTHWCQIITCVRRLSTRRHVFYCN